MNKILQDLKNELSSISEAIKSVIPNDEPLSIAHGNWSFPGVTRLDLAWYADELVDFLDAHDREPKSDNEFLYYEKFIPRLAFLRSHTIPQMWGSAANAVPAYMTTLGLLKVALESTFSGNNSAEISKSLKRLTAQTRGLEARVKDLSPRIDKLDGVLDVIESAHEAADSFPEDIETLKDSRNKIERITGEAEKDRAQVAIKREKLEEECKKINDIKLEAEAVLRACKEAYRASTSQGLAAAFTERSSTLSTSMWVWVSGLIAALCAGGYFGGVQIEKLSSSLQSGQANLEIIIINMILCVLSVGAPIWFAWISTKQINQRFRLAEDYAFKASISRAYEGYRSEAARLDKSLELSLLSSALNRLDEIPLRLVETTSHGSPLHELLSTDSIKRALGTVPDFASKVVKLADDSLSRLAGNPAKATEKTEKTGE